MMGRQPVARRLIRGPFVPFLEERILKDLSDNRRSSPRKKLWILVPGLDVRRRLRRRLADVAGGLFNVRFVLFPDLAREVLAAAPPGSAPPPVPLDRSSASVLLHGLVSGWSGPSYFGAVRRRGGFNEALQATLDDLDHAGADPGMLRRAAKQSRNSLQKSKLEEIAGIREAWISNLEAGGYQTTAGLLQAAARAAGAFPPEPLWIYGFYDLNGVQKDLLEALLPGRDVHVYFPDPGTSGRAFTEPTHRWFESQGMTDEEAGSSPALVEPFFFSAAGERREVEEAARRVLLLFSAGVRPGRIALVYRQADPYAALLRTVLDRAGIPADHEDRPALGETRPARALRLFVRAALSGGSRREIIDFLDIALPIHPRLAADGVALAARWDDFTVRSGIARGLDGWIPRLERLRDADAARRAAQGEAGRAGDEPDPVEEIGALIADIRSFLEASTWRERTGRLIDVVERWIGDEPGRESLLEAVSGLALLDRTGVPVESTLFRKVFEELLAGQRTEKTPLAREGVHVGDVLSVRGLHFDHLFLLGMAEKVFPRVAREDPILLDRERELLNAAGGRLVLKARSLEEEECLLAFVVLAAERLVCSWSRVEPAEARPQLPSPFLLRLAAAGTGESVDYETLETRVERVPLDLMARASAAGRGRPDDPVPDIPGVHPSASLDAAEFDALLVAAASGAERFPRLAGISRSSAILARAIEGDVARFRERRFTRFDGFIESEAGKEALAALSRKDGAYSASRLEVYARCPFKYFVETFLGVRSTENPEDLEGSSPLDRGVLVHEILREFLSANRRVRLSGLDRDTLRRTLEEITATRLALFEREFPTGHPLRWDVEKALLRDDLLAWLDFELARPGGSAAFGFEVSFGMAEEGSEEADPYSSPSAAPLVLPGGREVTFHGRIDRFDYDPDRRHARVVDYKSGKPPKGAGTRGLSGGRNLQLPIYLHALSRLVPELRSGEAEYLYLKTTTPAVYGTGSFETLRQELGKVVEPLVEGIEAGRFFPLPGTCGWRDECGYGSICGVRIEERFERKCSDPRVANHPAMVERRAAEAAAQAARAAAETKPKGRHE